MRPSSFEPTLQVKLMSAGLAGCCADLITFPLDLAKVRLQIQGENVKTQKEPTVIKKLKYRGMFNALTTIAREEGPRALYNGLVPGLQRQLAFCTVRIGLYDSFKKFYVDLFTKANINTKRYDIPLRIVAGITTGGLSVVCAQPTDVVKVRMQADGSRYKGSFQAYRHIFATEGVSGLWKGTAPNVTRNAIVNAAELVSYDLIKTKILELKLLNDNMPCHFLSAFGAGFITTVVASPVDVVKTRYMNSPPGKYDSVLQCASNMYKEAGISTFYKGFVPAFIRIGAWNIAMFVCFEQFKRHITNFSNRSATEKQYDLV